MSSKAAVGVDSIKATQAEIQSGSTVGVPHAGGRWSSGTTLTAITDEELLAGWNTVEADNNLLTAVLGKV